MIKVEVESRLNHSSRNIHYSTIMKSKSYCIVLFIGTIVTCYCANFSSWAKPKFKDNFHMICDKYDWISLMNNSVSKESDRYIIFYFNPPDMETGGLGDRLAGMISAYVFALRTKRKFILEVDKHDTGLSELFEPYLYHNLQLNISKIAGKDILDLRYCLASDDDECQLVKDTSHKVILIRSNRARICHWTGKPELPAYNELNKIGITNDSNLPEVAGCMLRSMLWPTQLLWDEVDNFLSNYSQEIYRVGFHYRCGDQHYFGRTDTPESKCWGSGTSKELSQCGKQLLSKHEAKAGAGARAGKESYVYIASDNPDIAKYLENELQGDHTSHTIITSPAGCHMDHKQSRECTIPTVMYWFILALSDHIVVQYDHIEGCTHPIRTGHHGTHNPCLSPHSSFSRSAIMYSLKPDIIRYAKHCTSVDHFSHPQWYRQTSGNWRCQ
eukprot:gene8480-17478_t